MGLLDVLPTLAELAGAETPGGLDGVSIADQLYGAPETAHPPFYWEFHERGFSQAVREGRWKAVRQGGPGQPTELYDLLEDRGEQHDLAESAPALAAGLARQMDLSRTDSPHWKPKMG